MRRIFLIGAAVILVAGAARAEYVPPDDPGEDADTVLHGGGEIIDPPYPPALYYEDDGAE